MGRSHFVLELARNILSEENLFIFKYYIFTYPCVNVGQIKGWMKNYETLCPSSEDVCLSLRKSHSSDQTKKVDNAAI